MWCVKRGWNPLGFGLGCGVESVNFVLEEVGLEDPSCTVAFSAFGREIFRTKSADSRRASCWQKSLPPDECPVTCKDDPPCCVSLYFHLLSMFDHSAVGVAFRVVPIDLVLVAFFQLARFRCITHCLCLSTIRFVARCNVRCRRVRRHVLSPCCTSCQTTGVGIRSIQKMPNKARMDNPPSVVCQCFLVS